MCRLRYKILFGGLLLILIASGSKCDRDVPTAVVHLDNGRNPAAVQRARQTLAQLYPERYRAIQRAILTVGKRQFTLDGVLRVAPEEGLHLAIVSTLGLVTDMRVRQDGSSEIMKVTPLFRENWARQYVARDLRWLFAPPKNLERAGWLDDGRLVLLTPPSPDGAEARYIFQPNGDRVEAIELVRNGRSVYQANLKSYRAFEGHPGELPAEFEVTAPAYRLHLRTAELSIPANSAGRSPSAQAMMKP